ncbi:hypothetical protein Marpi_1778 [Marinitoga piezophila KA3]|uniref:Uncharacterized protein n=1 Tax=Marinitoga piezophila (strain DSM 14283 / JCM 11233 / KA3) TaxID=443254 RepID=H2J5U0_MARPK|nr:hypothetical protein [Marinitoga piezophila]AEX86159.1 hypothetical protein Marpi_1778 [Marinitoga piezophila KA3]
MKCQLCKTNEAEIVQKFDYDGIMTEIGYCQKCMKEIMKFHLSPVNETTIKFFTTKLFFKNHSKFMESSVEISGVKTWVLSEGPIHSKRLIFKEDENSKIRDTQTVIERTLYYLSKEYEAARKNNDIDKMEAIEKIIKKLKRMLK